MKTNRFVLAVGVLIGMLPNPGQASNFHIEGKFALGPNLDAQLKSMIELLWSPENAPYCLDPVRQIKFPAKLDSLGNCDDGDATLFNGLLCAAGISEGCEGVKYSQIESTGEWLRSPRIVSNRALRPTNSFSPDMALGVQIYAVLLKSPAVLNQLSQWLQWIEKNRACIEGTEPNCIRGLPRFCRDDDENGCMLRLGDIVALGHTSEFLGIGTPPLLRALFREAGSHDARDELLLIRAGINDLGFPLHLVGVEIWLSRLEGDKSPTLQRAAEQLVTRQPLNPFFAYLAKGPTDEIKKRVLEICPTTKAAIPRDRVQWAWEREDNDQAWRNSMVWDCIFMARLLLE